MKKLMIAAAIVCAAAMSQAAIVNWGFGSSAASITVGATTTKLGGLSVQLYMVGVGGADDALVDTRKTTSSPASKKGQLSSGAGSSQSSLDASSTVAGGPVWNSTDGDLGRQYYVVMTTTQGGIDYTYTSSTVASSGLSQTAPGTVSFSINSTTGTSGKDTWVAAPEPTSGLLLLLGMAGLALKRKRA